MDVPGRFASTSTAPAVELLLSNSDNTHPLTSSISIQYFHMRFIILQLLYFRNYLSFELKLKISLKKKYLCCVNKLSAKAREFAEFMEEYQMSYRQYASNIQESSIISLKHYLALRALLNTILSIINDRLADLGDHDVEGISQPWSPSISPCWNASRQIDVYGIKTSE